MAVANTSVRFFRSTFTGAPTTTSAAGQAIGLLGAVLVDGFNSVTLSGLSVSGGVATATTASAHGFVLDGGTLGPVINVSGATTQTALNGDWRIASVPSTTSFTFVTDTADVTELGTVTAKFAPLGWTNAYSGTNKAIYQQPAGSGGFLRVVDSTTGYSTVEGAEGATDVDTLVNKFSGATSLYAFFKNGSASSSSWLVVGDNKGFIVYYLSGTYGHLFHFGDYDCSDLMPAFTYNCLMRASNSSSTSNTDSINLGAQSYFSIMRSYVGTAGGVQSVYMYPHAIRSTAFGASSHVYPSPVSNKLIYCGIDLWQSAAAGPIGRVRGLYSALHSNIAAGSNLTAFSGDGSELGKQIVLVHTSNQIGTPALIDITGPW